VRFDRFGDVHDGIGMHFHFGVEIIDGELARRRRERGQAKQQATDARETKVFESGGDWRSLAYIFSTWAGAD
jgi:hypothetical protein